MSLVETLVRVAVGSVLGFQSSLGAQNFLLRRRQSEADKERIYSPLYDEIAGGLELLEKHDSLQTPEWDRISKQDHLTYRIGDAVLQKGWTVLRTNAALVQSERGTLYQLLPRLC